MCGRADGGVRMRNGAAVGAEAAAHRLPILQNKTKNKEKAKEVEYKSSKINTTIRWLT